MKRATEELDSFMFPVPDEMNGMRQDQFGVTIESVKDHVSKKHKNPQDMSGYFDYVELVTPKPSGPPHNATLTDKAIWDAQLKS